MTPHLHILKRESPPLLILAIALCLSSCDDRLEGTTQSTLELFGVEAKVYGGEFLDSQRQDQQQLQIKLTPRSLITHLDLIINDCTTRDITLELGRDLSRFDVKFRVYLESNGQSVVSNNAPREYLVEGEGVFHPISEVYTINKGVYHGEDVERSDSSPSSCV